MPTWWNVVTEAALSEAVCSHVPYPPSAAHSCFEIGRNVYLLSTAYLSYKKLSWAKVLMHHASASLASFCAASTSTLYTNARGREMDPTNAWSVKKMGKLSFFLSPGMHHVVSNITRLICTIRVAEAGGEDGYCAPPCSRHEASRCSESPNLQRFREICTEIKHPDQSEPAQSRWQMERCIHGYVYLFRSFSTMIMTSTRLVIVTKPITHVLKILNSSDPTLQSNSDFLDEISHSLNSRSSAARRLNQISFKYQRIVVNAVARS